MLCYLITIGREFLSNTISAGELASVAQGLGAIAIRDLKSVGVRLGKFLFLDANRNITINIFSDL